MDGLAVGAALLSALLHAAWNAAVKASPAPHDAMSAQMLLSALFVLPLVVVGGLPPVAAWPWVVLSTVLSMGAVHALLKGYEEAPFGVVYPIARASSVLLVLPLAALVAGERVSARATGGVALVGAAVALLALRGGVLRTLNRRALAWTLAAAACTAGYVISDGRGVRQTGSALTYGATLSIANALLWLGWQRQRAARDARRAAEHDPAAAAALPPIHGWLRALPWRRTVPVALASTASYLLILYALRQAPIALASALRDTSAIFAVLIAALLLKERLDGRSLAAVAMATAGAVLVRGG